MSNRRNLRLVTESDSLRMRARGAMKKLKLTITRLAKEVGRDRAAISKWLRDKYEGDNAELEEMITAWLDIHFPKEAPEFIETPSAEKIISALAYAHQEGRMGLIYGGPGVGKTTSIRTYMRQYPERVWLATMTPASSGLVSALETVAHALSIGIPNGGARRISTVIREVLADDRAMVIIDEAQHLSLTAIEELRAIHDATGCAMVFVGNETSYARLTGGARSAHFAQLYSRLGVRLSLARPTDADVTEVCNAWSVSDPQSREFLRRLAMQPGALRSVSMLLSALHRGNKPYTPDNLRSACKVLGVEV